MHPSFTREMVALSRVGSTLWAIIEEARHRSAKVYCCFVDFRKAFDFVPRVALFERIWAIRIFELLLLL